MITRRRVDLEIGDPIERSLLTDIQTRRREARESQQGQVSGARIAAV
jgi:hypothetical protein